MDQKTFLKEMAKHAQRNTTDTRREDSKNLKKIQIKTFKPKDDCGRLMDSIDINSLELFAEMMRDRYGNRDED
ncbi:hypothetical protein FORMA_10500 [Formosa sp. Hel3_A1_48]|jgi:hypothetical protein|uniref:hypothetical protein n=1 Tax=Formosa sp. Hel3_A1_48 TaxID=1336795 RepID=UPI00084E0FBF|nr:hypothetical protein [Formosa sp. Hel3_A1_48]AOR26217.1 hypothetical protein FORMA_10500 [Formosa sp. Hel3_A1_48]